MLEGKGMKRTIKESQMSGLFNNINERLHEFGEANVYFDSDVEHVTISVNPQSVRRSGIINVMQEFGYRYYDCGANGGKIMMTFVPDRNGMSESKKNKKKTINEAQLRQIVIETVKRILKENSAKALSQKTQNESKAPKYWQPDEFVNWDEWVADSNYGYDFFEKNEEKSDKLCVPLDQRCHLCNKALTGDKYKPVKFSTASGNSHWCYNPDAEGEDVKIGNTCFKSLQRAHDRKYGV